jgi:hypothetical protein
MAVTRGRTQSTPYSPMDVVLCMALSLRFHGTADAIRQTARSIRDRAPYEHRPNLKKLATTLSDDKVLAVVWQMFDQTRALIGAHEAPPPPRCHMTPMSLDRHQWVCQHCKHTKERTL